jgi:predicted peptidase
MSPSFFSVSDASLLGQFAPRLIGFVTGARTLGYLGRGSWTRRLLLASVGLMAAAGGLQGDEGGAHFTVPANIYKARDAAIAAMGAALSASNPDAFEPFLYKDGEGRKLWYRLFKPDMEDGRKYPLLLVLHGAGGRGTDNLVQITGRGAAVSVGIWTLPEAQKASPCFVLAPQCPPEPDAWIKNGDWGGASHPLHPELAHALAMVMDVLVLVAKENPVDEDRLYVMGASMGGYGTWDLLARYPDRFAAAIPVCGALADDQAARIAHVPVWIFHGSADDSVSVSDSRSAYAQLRAAGGSPRYTEYEGGDHHIAGYAWTEPGLMEWLFSQRRR